DEEGGMSAFSAVFRFWRAENGNFAMMLAVSLPLLLGAVAFSVDLASMTRSKARLSSALDAAMLAASRINDKDIDRKELFQQFLVANLVNERMMYDVSGALEV